MTSPSEADAGILLLGIDTGGTFTDFVLVCGGELTIHKVLSTPDAPERAILQGVAELGLDTADARDRLRIVHGSTVATNAVLEGKGAATAYIANRGLGDVLTIARQTRETLYDLQPPRAEPPVPRAWCLETGGRLGPDGAVIEPLTEDDLGGLRRQLDRLRPEAVAINLLFSFVDPSFEERVESAVPDGVFVARSSAVLPEYREYERGVTTWLNAYVGPLVEGYLRRLTAALDPAPVTIMQSSAETISADQAAGRAVHMLFSGPAGGLAGARFIGRHAGRERLMTFDMGGTSTDVALLDGPPALTTEGSIGSYPLCVPTVDMHTIGAGGGSLAHVDAGGLLQVGPESAGADPGPACYGAGGANPTVTDANLVLGRLQPDAFLGGAMKLDVEAAGRALDRVAEPLGLSREEAADGVIRVANDHMARALRVISVQRGRDPREYALTCFGGAGGLHVCALAEALEMSEAIVPLHAGVLSALGMLAAPPGRQLSRTMAGLLSELDPEDIARGFEGLVEQAGAELAAEGVARQALRVRRQLDLRYRGQSYTLTVPWTDPAGSERAFHRAHADRYGHALEMPVELVNLRVDAHGPEPDVALAPLEDGGAERDPGRYASLHGVSHAVPVWRRRDLSAEQHVGGPALVTETVSTTYVAPGWRARVEPYGNLMLSREQ